MHTRTSLQLRHIEFKNIVIINSIFSALLITQVLLFIHFNPIFLVTPKHIVLGVRDTIVNKT